MATSPRATMADVARAAGVSPTTVSHALNGKGRVDPTTREHVRAVARELGYAPSRAARSLALGRSDTIGLLLPEIAQLPTSELLASDWYGRVAVGASQAALDHRRALAILPTAEPAGALQRFGLEGAVILDPLDDDPRCAAAEEAGIPYVLLGEDRARPAAPRVVPDTAGGMVALLDHVVAAGARRVGVVATDIDWSAGRDALGAYERWVSARGQAPQVAVAEVAGRGSREETGAAGERAADELLRLADPPDALVGLFEDFGRGLVSAALARGLDVPGDVLVAQDVDGVKAQINQPAITALDLQPALQVAEAVELLLAGDGDAVSPVVTPVTLNVRASTTRG